jgi:DNA helicase IV
MPPYQQLVTVVLVLLLSGCVKVRLLTYPAGFSHYSYTDINKTMSKMAYSMDALNNLANTPIKQHPDNAKAQSTRQNAILEELEILDNLALSLSGNPSVRDELDQSMRVTRHLLIDEHIDDFLLQVSWARQLAQDDPPNYFAVGQLTGGCEGCHRLH